MRVSASSDTTNSNSTRRTLVGYNEPTSVLDLRRSSSPARTEEKPLIISTEVTGGGSDHQFPVDDHVMRSMDWDSIMKELELDDNSTPNLKSNFPILPHFAVVEPPLPGFPVSNPLSSWTEIVERVRAIKEFSGVSPIPFFSHFTVNQAILDSLSWKQQSSSPMFAHIVAFEIGFGCQYASLMREIAEKSANGVLRRYHLRRLGLNLTFYLCKLSTLSWRISEKIK